MILLKGAVPAREAQATDAYGKTRAIAPMSYNGKVECLAGKATEAERSSRPLRANPRWGHLAEMSDFFFWDARTSAGGQSDGRLGEPSPPDV